MPPASSREKPVRKRNVVSRGRTGCLTCRRRRLKCDEMKPGCNNCRRINFPCEGYTQRITFKDQTNLIVSRASGKPAVKKGQAPNARNEEIGGTDDASSTHSCHTSDGVKRPSSPSTPQSLKPKWEDTDITVRRNSNSRFTPETHASCIIADKDSRRFSSCQSEPFSTPEPPSVVIRNGYMTPRSSISAGYTPSPSRVLPNSSLPLTGAFEFPEDYTYYEYSTSGGFTSLSRVLPLTELLKSQSVSPHVYDAAMALAALTLSSSECSPRTSINIRRHAFHHSLKAIQGLNNELSSRKSANSSYYSMDTNTVFSPFATAMLLANFELQRGAVPSWRSHMQGAALCLSVGYKQIMQNPVGMLLIRAFARMALLLRLYNKDYSVTTPDTIPPKIAKWLDHLLKQSPNLHDRILLLVEEVTALEIEKRQQPELDSLWSEISLEFLGKLDEWRKDLPVTEVPVEGSFSEGYVTISSPNGASLVRVPALGFPNSTDPCTSAVNYAAYLCTGMRARTRYLPDVGRELPPDAEQTALIICRIAAGIPPTRFGESFAYSYGMLPFLVGAHRWSTNQGLRNWVEHWLAGYQGPREGIWNIQQTLRLLAAMDRESSRPGWQFVCARVIDEQPDPSADLEESNSNAPFKVVFHGIERDSPSTNVIVVE